MASNIGLSTATRRYGGLLMSIPSGQAGFRFKRACVARDCADREARYIGIADRHRVRDGLRDSSTPRSHDDCHLQAKPRLGAVSDLHSEANDPRNLRSESGGKHGFDLVSGGLCAGHWKNHACWL